MGKFSVFYKLAILMFSLVLGSTYSHAKEFLLEQEDNSRTINSGYYRMKDERNLRPWERIRLNEQKVQRFPGLRERWNPRHWQPASTAAYQGDNFAEVILLNFRKDPQLSKIPAYLKVKAIDGNITLEGTVKSPEQKQLIGHKVSQMEGVRNVENLLMISPSYKL
jgi:hypothetical protein